jgi:opacity protein-like surface antigen
MPKFGTSIGAAALALSATLLAPVTLASEGPVSWLVNGGWTPTMGTTSDYLKDGWTLGTGVDFHWDSSSPFSVQFDLSYSDFNATNKLITLGQSQSFRTDGGRGDIWALTAAGKYTMPVEGVRGYGLLGFGAYHRYVELTQTALGSGYICDPWWGYCYPGVVVGDAIVASTSNTKFGFNVGAGVEVPLPGGSAWFIEARYHWIDGSKQTEFLPIQIGFKF